MTPDWEDENSPKASNIHKGQHLAKEAATFEPLTTLTATTYK